MTPIFPSADGSGADVTDVSQRDDVEPDEPFDGLELSGPLTGDQLGTHATGDTAS